MGSCTFTIYWINKLNNNWFNEVNKQPKWHGKIILTKSSIFLPDIEAGSIGFPVVRNKICFLCTPAFCFMFLLVNKLLLSSATRLAFFALLRFMSLLFLFVTRLAFFALLRFVLCFCCCKVYYSYYYCCPPQDLPSSKPIFIVFVIWPSLLSNFLSLLFFITFSLFVEYGPVWFCYIVGGPGIGPDTTSKWQTFSCISPKNCQSLSKKIIAFALK